ncbi:hypothetical protein [Streptomyces sp. P9-A2]|uniref:hypothetical protein n=1 Tax=Streptomyces sp. P9-A2 TaxID=3072284 RepID=UPI002FCC8BEE
MTSVQAQWWVNRRSSCDSPPSRPGPLGFGFVGFHFDPTRAALLLLGGDKAGNWERWYRDHIPLAEQLHHEYTSDEDEE